MGGLDRGFLIELVVFLGAVAVGVFSVNYWPVVAEWIRPWLANDPRLDAISFALVFLNLFLFVRFLVRLLTKPLSQKQHTNWLTFSGGLIVGALRGAWWSLFLMVVLASTGWDWMHESVAKYSIVGQRLLPESRQLLLDVSSRFPGAEHRRSELIPAFRHHS